MAARARVSAASLRLFARVIGTRARHGALHVTARYRNARLGRGHRASAACAFDRGVRSARRRGVTGLAGRLLHLRIMLTDSAAPAGIYRLRSLRRPGAARWLPPACRPRSRGRDSRAAISKGAIVRREPSRSRRCIGALPGDVVELEPGWVAVNGVKFPNSQTAARDSAGRPLAHVPWGARRVGAGEVWLFGFNNRAELGCALFRSGAGWPVVRGVLQAGGDVVRSHEMNTQRRTGPAGPSPGQSRRVDRGGRTRSRTARIFCWER